MPKNALDDRQVHLVCGKERGKRMAQVMPSEATFVTLWDDAGLLGCGAKIVLGRNACRSWDFSFRLSGSKDPVSVTAVAGFSAPGQECLTERGVHHDLRHGA